MFPGITAMAAPQAAAASTAANVAGPAASARMADPSFGVKGPQGQAGVPFNTNMGPSGGTKVSGIQLNQQGSGSLSAANQPAQPTRGEKLKQLGMGIMKGYNKNAEQMAGAAQQAPSTAGLGAASGSGAGGGAGVGGGETAATRFAEALSPAPLPSPAGSGELPAPTAPVSSEPVAMPMMQPVQPQYQVAALPAIPPQMTGGWNMNGAMPFFQGQPQQSSYMGYPQAANLGVTI